MVLAQSVAQARWMKPTPERIHVYSGDAVCEVAIDRAAREPGVAVWSGTRRPHCPGPRCGPRDGNPLVRIHHEHDDCFRVATLRGTGGSGHTRCASGRAARSAVVY